MGYEDKILPASFKGVPFLVRGNSTPEGRKIILHDYVNSDRREFEDLGKSLPIFSFDAFVHGNNAGELRDALKNKLLEKGSGVLNHPNRGTYTVVALPFTVQENQRTTGIINFSLQFSVITSVKEPSQIQSTVSNLNGISSSFRETAQTAAIDLYEIPTDNPFTQEIAVPLKIQSEGLLDVIKNIDDEAAKALTLPPVLEMINSTSAFLLRPSTLFPQLTQTFDHLAGFGDISRWAFVINNFGDDPILRFLTGRTAKRRSAYGTLVSFFQTNSMVSSYQSATAADYDTVPELNEVQSKLNEDFIEITENPIEESIINDPGTKEALLEVRKVATDIFHEKEQNAFNVESFDPKSEGFALATYRVYGDLDNLDLIKRLNKNNNASLPVGEIEMVST